LRKALNVGVRGSPALRPGWLKALPDSDTLAPVMRQIDFGLFFYHWSAMAAQGDPRPQPENARQAVHNVNAGSVNTSLEGADVGTVDLRTIAPAPLATSRCPPELPQVECQDLSYFHAPEGSALKSISPRSILDKVANATVDTSSKCKGE